MLKDTQCTHESSKGALNATRSERHGKDREALVGGPFAGAGITTYPASSLCLACLHASRHRSRDLRDDEAIKEAGSAGPRSAPTAVQSPGGRGRRTKEPDEGGGVEAQRYAQAAPVHLDKEVPDDGVGPSPPVRRQLLCPGTCAVSRVPHSG